ncbi:MarR family winged helix-turn-helix transcriptional regulator [Desulfospira joergensenii]|uniref:MarR family winged helix-turn-helix transcriptional regulator n=1 Tax=Desulfospira joergensenii TaxID=53329 RepID=UPI0003B4585D|nr:MarR family transcriptional regulator [Desulfospira joergensenii]
METKTDKHQTSFGYRFAMLHRLQMALCRKEILNQGIQASQLPFIVSLVREEKPVTQDYLSGCLAIDKGTTARAICQLEKNGYVIRRSNPENRRQNLVTATEKAHAAADKLLAALTRAGDIFVRGFTDEEKKLVLDLMDRMLLNAREAHLN